MDNRLKGVISLCLASSLWGLWGIFSRFLGLSFGVFYQSFSRSLILFVIVLFFVLLKKSWKKIERGDLKWFFIISAGGLFSGAGSFISFNHLAISTTLFYYYVGAVIGGYLLGKLFFAERMTKIKLIALVSCLAGLLIVFYSTTGQGDIVFIISALAAGLGGSVWSVFSKKVTMKYSLAQTILIDNFNFTIGCFLLTVIFKEAIILPSFSLLWLYVFLFSLSVLAASLLHFYGFRYVQAQSGTLILLLEVIFGIFFGWLFFRETLTLSSVLGGTMIVFGAALPSLIPEGKFAV